MQSALDRAAQLSSYRAASTSFAESSSSSANSEKNPTPVSPEDAESIPKVVDEFSKTKAHAVDMFKVSLGRSKIAGMGLFANGTIQKDRIVCYYLGKDFYVATGKGSTIGRLISKTHSLNLYGFTGDQQELIGHRADGVGAHYLFQNERYANDTKLVFYAGGAMVNSSAPSETSGISQKEQEATEANVALVRANATMVTHGSTAWLFIPMVATREIEKDDEIMWDYPWCAEEPPPLWNGKRTSNTANNEHKKRRVILPAACSVSTDEKVINS